MRKEDLKDWTKDQMVRKIISLYQSKEILEKEVKRMDKCIGSREEKTDELTKENDELRKRLKKLESGICGGSPCIVSEFHSFEGESWIKATTYDDVLLRLKKANERITDLEQDILNKSTDELKQVEKLSSENKSLKDENKALKQQIKYLEDICDGSCFANETDDRDEKIAKMQDRIDSDCVRINRLKITIETLVDMYGLLRNQVGMD